MPTLYYFETCMSVEANGYCPLYDRVWKATDDRLMNGPNDHQPHAYRLLLHGSRNSGGRLANFDPGRIEEVAFGIKDFEVVENGSTSTLKMTERADRTLVLVDAENGAWLGSSSAAEPSSIVIPASGKQARTIDVLSQPVPRAWEGTKTATFAQSSFLIDSSQAVTVDFEIDEK